MEKNKKEGNKHSLQMSEPRKRPNENNDGNGKLNNKCFFEKKSLKKPLIYIKFRNKHVARRYGPQIKKMLNQFIQDGTVNENKKDITEIQVLEKNSNSKDCDVNNFDDEYLFDIDTRPRTKDDLDVPTYKTRGILLNDTTQKVEEESNKPPPPSKVTCFNCLGEHLIRDCRRPRNSERIQENKNRLLNKNHSKSSRYHKEEGDSNSYEFMPGQLSDSLVQALGLRKGELPLHIYRMRVYGYPPGWLEEARIVHSGLSVFDSSGQAIADPNDEEGEIFEPGSKDEYDFRKIWDYPGFNVTGEFIDEAENLGYPAMSYEQSKEVMLKHLAPRAAKAYRRRRQKPLNQVIASQDIAPTSSADMDLSDISDGETTIESSQVNMEENTNDTKSLTELENQKLRLLEELEKVNSKSSGDTEEDNSQEEPQSPSVSCESKPTLSTPIRLRTTSVNLGTPIIESVSPFSTLPNREKFSRDIQDVINFENLPNSTGKYEAMNGLLHKVRKEVHRLQNEDGNL